MCTATIGRLLGKCNVKSVFKPTNSVKEALILAKEERETLRTPDSKHCSFLYGSGNVGNTKRKHMNRRAQCKLSSGTHGKF